MAYMMEVIARLGAEDDGLTSTLRDAQREAQHLQKSLNGLNKSMLAVGAMVATAGFGLYKFGKASFDAAARVSELNVAMDAVGKSTGVGADKMREAAKAIRDKGIEMAAAQQMAIEYAQGNLNLAQAADVARVAQDLAVISQKNSTDVATILTRAIKTGNSQLLKSAGVSRQASEAYADYARTLGKSSTALSATERQQAIINLILDEGKKVAGVYEASMTEAGKVLRSFKRIVNDVQVAFGALLVAGFGPIIKSSYDLFSAFSKLLREGGALYPVLKQLEEGMKALLAPLTESLKDAAEFVKGLKGMKVNADGLGKSFAHMAPLLSALAAGLSAFAGRGLLSMVKPLAGIAKFLSPVGATIAVLIVLLPEARDAFLKIADALKPLVPAAANFAKAFGDAGATVAEGLAGLINALSGPLAPLLNTIAKAVYGLSVLVEKFSFILQPLIIFLGINWVRAFVAAKMATLSLALANGTATRAQLMFANTLRLGNTAVNTYKVNLVATGSATKAFAATTVAGMRAATASVLSFMAAAWPMLIVAGLVYGAMKMWEFFANRGKELKERTNELTEAIKSQVDALKSNNDQLGKWVGNVENLGHLLATTGEDGDEMTLALHTMGKTSAELIPLLADMNKSVYDSAFAQAKLKGATEEQAAFIAHLVSTTDDYLVAINGLPPELDALTRGMIRLNGVRENQNYAQMAADTMDRISLISKEHAELVALTKAEVTQKYNMNDAAQASAAYIETLSVLGPKIAAMEAANKKAAVAASKTAIATKTMVQRLKELVPSAEDGKFAVEELVKEMYGIEAFDSVQNAKKFLDLKKGFTELMDSTKAAASGADSLKDASVSLFDQLGKQAEAMMNAGYSAEEVAAAQTIMRETFIEAAVAGGALREQVMGALEAMGMLAGYRPKVVIDADIAALEKKLTAAMEAIAAFGSGSARDMEAISAMNRALAKLRAEAAALDTVAPMFDRYSGAQKGAAKSARELTGEKKRLADAILKLVNDALTKEEEKLADLREKLNRMKSATRSAIYESNGLANAFGVAQAAADEYNQKIEEQEQAQRNFAEAVASSIYEVLSLSQAMQEQQASADEMRQASADLAGAQQRLAQGEAVVNAAFERFQNATSRQARRQALQEIYAASEALVPMQQDLAVATERANMAAANQLTFLGRLEQQASRARTFAERLRQLVSMGLGAEGMRQIVSAGALAGTQMADELIAGGSSAVTRVNELFAEIGQMSQTFGMDAARDLVPVGERMGADLVAALVSQAEKAKAFAEKIKTLVAMGLSPENITQVLAAGVEAGTKIADSLINGGASAIAKANEIERALFESAQALEKLLASTFYDTGIALAEQIVAGLKDRLKKLEDSLPKMSADAMRRLLEGLPEDLSTPTRPPSEVKYPNFMAAVRATKPNYVFDPMKPVAKAKIAFPKLYKEYKDAGLALGNGGIVTRPQISLIGEKGPEAVIPLDRLNANPSSNINIVVNAGGLSSGGDIADAIIAELVRWQRRNGTIPVVTKGA